MAKVIVQHHVADFEQWYAVFKEHGEVRRSNGATGHTLHRGVEDPDTILIVNSFSSVDGARAFMTDPSLKDVMARAGVDNQPQVWLMDETEEVTY